MSTSMREALKQCRNYIASPLRMTKDEDEQTRRNNIVAAADAALSSPAPDGLSDEERASIESARKALSAYRETLSDGQLIAFPDLLEKSIAIIDNLSRQPEAEPVAWLRDLQPDAEDEALAVCNRIDPGAFAVYTSPRLDREKVKALIQWVEETLLDPFDWIGTGDSFSASLYERRTREKWKELADAIMREAR